MPVPNSRIAIVGAVKADRDFDIVEVSRREARRLADLMVKDVEKFARELDRILGQTAARNARGRR